jgi:ureidoglycolate lyase
MPVKINSPLEPLLIKTRALNADLFSDFGAVIENPAPSLVPSLNVKDFPSNAVQANQGTALKYLDVTHMQNYYSSAPSNVPARAVMNMFVCAPRTLLGAETSTAEGLFPVEILERHPYTTQTFIPLGISPQQVHEARYLVIVAPSLPPSPADEMLPCPISHSIRHPLPGRGLPDVKRIKAFVAKGSQAVTYGAGTWHAPMVVVGQRAIDFVVVQFANGVGIEDCQEAAFDAERQGQLMVDVPGIKPMEFQELSKL